MKSNAIEILRTRYIGNDEARKKLLKRERILSLGPEAIHITLFYDDDEYEQLKFYFLNPNKIEALKKDLGLLGELLRGEF